MNSRLRSAWDNAVRTALDPSAPDLRRPSPSSPDPDEAVLEALGLAIVLSVTGTIDEVSDDTKKALSRCGRHVLLAMPAEREDTRVAAAVGREGLKALAGDVGFDPRAGDPLPPSPGRLIAMLRGEPDGISAGSCAIRTQNDTWSRERLQLLLATSLGDDARVSDGFSAAAAPNEAMRDPQQGRLVAHVSSPAADIVLFDEPPSPVLAIYASDAIAVRLEAEGVTTRQMLPGYWAGEIENGKTVVTGTLEVGAQRASLEIALLETPEDDSV